LEAMVVAFCRQQAWRGAQSVGELEDGEGDCLQDELHREKTSSPNKQELEAMLAADYPANTSVLCGTPHLRHAAQAHGAGYPAQHTHGPISHLRHAAQVHRVLLQLLLDAVRHGGCNREQSVRHPKGHGGSCTAGHLMMACLLLALACLLHDTHKGRFPPCTAPYLASAGRARAAQTAPPPACTSRPAAL